MPASQQNIAKVISILKDADSAINELLQDSPDLALHGSTMLRRLCNGYAHASGIAMDESAGPQEPKVYLTHIAGIPVSIVTEQVTVSESIPTPAEQDQLKELVDQAFEDFPTMDSSAILESYNELIIRGVGVKAGLPITPTDPAIIDTAIIDTIKAAITATKEPEKAIQPTKKK